MIFKIGDKVIPHAKTKGMVDLNGSSVWREAKEKGQPYLFVDYIQDDVCYCATKLYGKTEKFAQSDLSLHYFYYMEPEIIDVNYTDLKNQKNLGY